MRRRVAVDNAEKVILTTCLVVMDEKKKRFASRRSFAMANKNQSFTGYSRRAITYVEHRSLRPRSSLSTAIEKFNFTGVAY